MGEFRFFCDKSASSPAAMFASIDADGDGNLTLEELTEALKLRPELDGLLHLGLKSRSVEDCFKEMDLDGDGAFQYEEFKFFCDKSASSPAIVFAPIDADGDGNLTLEELAAALKLRPELDGLLHLGLKARSLEDCFKEMDLDGDGAIQLDEFRFFCDKSASSPAAMFASIDADGDGNL